MLSTNRCSNDKKHYIEQLYTFSFATHEISNFIMNKFVKLTDLDKYSENKKKF